jgi:ASC-1-like (ASCH) protein
MISLKLPTLDFNQIVDGQKTIELRAPSSNHNYSALTRDEDIEFINQDNLKKAVKKVLIVKHFSNLEEMYSKIDYIQINPHLKSKQESIDKTNQIPGYQDRITKGGIFAIFLK